MTTFPPILIVEDDNDSRASFREILELAGFTVIEAPNGRDALDRLLSVEEPVPSLLMLDLEMPCMSGRELVAILKNYHRLSRIPVLVVTGSGWPLNALDQPAVSAHIAKPCSPNALVQTVNALLARSAENEQRSSI